MGFDEEADTEPQRPKPKTDKPPLPDPSPPKLTVTREVPKQSAALIVHDPGSGHVKLELLCPEGSDGDNMPLAALVARVAMEFIVGISQGEE